MIEIVYKKTNELIPYARNSRTHSNEQVQQVAGSIKEFGFTNPILIDEDGRIIAGHGRCMAAQLLKMDEVPTITLSGLTDAQKKAYIIKERISSITDKIVKEAFLTNGTEYLYDVYNHKLSGKKPNEIADILGVSIDQIRKDIVTARRKGKDTYVF